MAGENNNGINKTSDFSSYSPKVSASSSSSTLGKTQTREESIDLERYQTFYAKREGSVAAPTAGLHFTNEFLDEIQEMGDYDGTEYNPDGSVAREIPATKP